MSINQTIICDDIELMDEGVTIIACTKDNEKVIVPFYDLDWRNPYENGDDYDLPLFLTLKEISNQLIETGYKPTFYVWREMGLSGKIYAYNNDCWREYGETKGYA